MKFNKLINNILESNEKTPKLILPDKVKNQRNMLKLIKIINQYIETILNFDDKIQKDIFEKITEAKNVAEFQKRMEWLSEGSLLYHTMHKEYGKMEYGGRPIERELYKKIVEHINQDNI